MNLELVSDSPRVCRPETTRGCHFSLEHTPLATLRRETLAESALGTYRAH
jgi:hypothetical protein